MFTHSIQEETVPKSQSKTQNSTSSSPQLLTHHQGLNLTHFQCYELKPNPIYSNYKSNDVHYAISAMQKRLKPPTKYSLRRMKRKNYQKNLAQKSLPETQPNYVQPLNPKSPEVICLKALRTQFKNQLFPPTEQEDKKSVQSSQSSVRRGRVNRTEEEKNAVRKPKFIRKKENQLRRRIELIALVKQNYQILLKIFGRQKLKGYNRRTKCPKISRQEVKQALKKHYQQQIKNLNDTEYIKKMVDDKIEQRKKIKEEYQQRINRRRLVNDGDDAELDQDRSINSSNGNSSESDSSIQQSDSEDGEAALP